MKRFLLIFITLLIRNSKGVGTVLPAQIYLVEMIQFKYRKASNKHNLLISATPRISAHPKCEIIQ